MVSSASFHWRCLALQFRRDVGPLAAVLSYEDEPFAVLGQLHVVDVVVIVVILFERVGQGLWDAGRIGIVVLSVEGEVASVVGDGHVAAAPPFGDVLLDVVTATRLGKEGDGEDRHQCHYECCSSHTHGESSFVI